MTSTRADGWRTIRRETARIRLQSQTGSMRGNGNVGCGMGRALRAIRTAPFIRVYFSKARSQEWESCTTPMVQVIQDSLLTTQFTALDTVRESFTPIRGSGKMAKCTETESALGMMKKGNCSVIMSDSTRMALRMAMGNIPGDKKKYIRENGPKGT